MTTNKIDTSFNGYKNYETWSVKLIFDNTESLYHFLKNTIKTAIEACGDDRWQVKECIAETIKDTVENMRPKTNNDIWNQLMTHAQSEVDFMEIAETVMSDYESNAY